MSADLPIIATKLIIPRIRSDYYPRDRLINSLNLGLEKQLIVISSGAGYGKTSLLTHWVKGLKIPVIWYSIDRKDKDFLVFISYLIEGIESKYPGVGNRMKEVLSSSSFPASIETLLGMFINASLEIAPEELIIVLDDYHHVCDSEEIQNCMEFLIKYLPVNIFIVISSRNRVSIPIISRRRAQNEILELTEEDLKFTRLEIKSLISNNLSLAINYEQLNSLDKLTEGWIIGIQLAMNSISKKGELRFGHLISELLGKQQALFQYLASESFSSLNEEVKNFLHRTSVISRIDVPVANFMADISNSPEIFGFLDRNNLFLIPIDNDGNWFRYHPLFKEFLENDFRNKYGEKKYFELQTKAAQYYEKKREWIESVEHYLIARRYDDSCRVIEIIAQGLLNFGKFDTLLRWIYILPDDIVSKRPWMQITQGKIWEIRGKLSLARDFYERGRLLSKAVKDKNGLWNALMGSAWVRYHSGEYEKVKRLCDEILTYLNDDQKKIRAEVYYLLANCYYDSGNINSGVGYDEKARDLYRQIGYKIGEAKVNLSLAEKAYVIRGDFKSALQFCESAISLFRETRNKEGICHSLSVSGYIYHCTGKHFQAFPLLDEALRIAEGIGYKLVKGKTLYYLAEIYRELREYQQSIRLYNESMDISRELKDSDVYISSLLGLSRLYGVQGQKGKALNFCREALNHVEKSINKFMIAKSLSSIGRFMVVSLKETVPAREYLHRALDIFKKFNSKYELARLYLYLAMSYRGSKESVDFMNLCIDIVKTEEYDFLFLKKEKEISMALLLDLILTISESSYSRGILFSFGDEIIEAIGERVGNSDKKFKDLAINLLSQFNSLNARKYLMEITKDKDTKISEKAKKTLFEFPVLSEMPLKIYCFGKFEVFRGNVLIKDSEWISKKAKSIFKYLLMHKNKVIPKEVIMELIWPEMDPETVEGRFYKALSTLRHILEPGLGKGEESRYLVAREKGYTVNIGEGSWIDVDEFIKYVTSGQKKEKEGKKGEGIEYYKKAINLCRGEYLEEDVYEEWTSLERSRLKEIKKTLLERIALYLLNQGDYDECIEYCIKGLSEDKWEEEFYKIMMKCYIQQGKRSDAIRVYKTCQKILKEDLDVAPTQAINSLYSEILANR